MSDAHLAAKETTPGRSGTYSGPLEGRAKLLSPAIRAAERCETCQPALESELK